MYKDKVVLRPKLPFLPKVVSFFYLNGDIVLPFLCPVPKLDKKIALYCLDVVRAVRVYLATTVLGTG